MKKKKKAKRPEQKPAKNKQTEAANNTHAAVNFHSSPESDKNAENRKGEPAQQSSNRGTNWSLITQFGILSVTIAYCVVAYCQWRAMREALEVSERPWVIYKTATQITIDPDRPIPVDVEIENTGRSPAINVSGVVNVVTRPANIPDQIPIQDDDGTAISNSVVASGTPAVVRLFVGPYSQSEVDDIIKKKVQVHIVGIISYSDQFSTKEKYTTRFCIRHDPSMSFWASCQNNNYAN